MLSAWVFFLDKEVGFGIMTSVIISITLYCFLNWFWIVEYHSNEALSLLLIVRTRKITPS